MMFKEKYFIHEENHFIKLMSQKSKVKFCLPLAVYLQVLSPTRVSRVNHTALNWQLWNCPELPVFQQAELDVRGLDQNSLVDRHSPYRRNIS